MTSRANLNAAQAFFPELHRALDRVPPYSMGDAANTIARDKAFADITAMIEANGGAVNIRHDATTIRLFGIRASATSGIGQACRNWIAQLTLKAMAAQNEAAA